MTAEIGKKEFETKICTTLDWAVKRVKGEVSGRKDIHEKIAEWKRKAQEDSENEI